METYLRKIVPLQAIKNHQKEISENSTAYYKLEKRHNRYRVTVVIEGFLNKNERAYQFCTVQKQAESLTLHVVKNLLVVNSKINEIFPLDDIDGEFMVGAVILNAVDQKPIDLKNACLIGYQDIPFDIGSVNILKSKEPMVAAEPVHVIPENGEDQGNIIEVLTQKEQRLKDVKEQAVETILEEQEDLTDFIRNEAIREIEKIETETTQGEPILQVPIENKVIEPAEELVEEKLEEIAEGKVDKTIEEKDSELHPRSEKKNLFESLDEAKKQLEKNEIDKYLDELFQSNQKMNPFENDDPKNEWIKIEITDLVFLPIESWIYINNAFLMTCYRKYKHLILGRTKGERHIQLGVPDVYFFRGSVIANLCGFYHFNSAKNAHPKPGEYGYWIIQANV